MSGFELREGQGSLFRNKTKKSEKQPDYRGSCKINGVILEIGGWIKKPANGGDSFISFRFEEKQDQPPKDRQVNEQKRPEPEGDDPF